MSNKVKTYFLVPGWDFPVGSIRLGSVIANPSQPHIALWTIEAAEIDTPTFPSHKYDFTETIGQTKKGKVGLFARFLQIFGVGAEASVQHDEKNVEKYSFKDMCTEWFLPSDKLIKKATDSSRVVGFVEQSDYEAAVYMVTGLKTVTGASVTTLKSKGRGLRVALGFDATPAGVPVSIGPEAEHSSQGSEYATFSNSSHVVFAYQLKLIKIDEEKAISTSEFNDGALFGVHDQGSKARHTLQSKDTLSDEELKTAFGEGVTSTFDEADDEECICVVPRSALGS
jgi:hypothetical protein